MGATNNVEWVDTHGHLFMLDDDPADVLDRAAEAGVTWVMCPGVDAASSTASRGISNAHPRRVLWSAGLHPHQAERWPDEADTIAELAADAHALGECGLDFYRNLAPTAAQVDAFRAQLELASELGKPIIIHCRDAFAAVHDMLESADLGERAILHCWTGGPKWTRRFAALGATFSFAGPITYDTADTLRLGVEEAPMERTMIETDSPYLTPEPLRGSDNEPANVHLTGAKVAEVWGVSVDEVARLTTQTATEVFGYA